MRLLLADVLRYSATATELIAGKTYLAYANDEKLRLATQRCLANIGEALSQASGQRPDLSLYIADVREAVAMRHRLVHSYHNIADAPCWSILNDDRPNLVTDVRDLIEFGFVQEQVEDRSE